ncbi:uncharacterized protein LOC122040055 [Zingiber officinale]|uniref:uncharacterized protein LOC122040055 n=1 Tax=Zingiber officinale TaxID=94328 RepID=UPI001C4CA252|nr:uncharacterized protein LOC122040055 [Zingiber officinale]
MILICIPWLIQYHDRTALMTTIPSGGALAFARAVVAVSPSRPRCYYGLPRGKRATPRPIPLTPRLAFRLGNVANFHAKHRIPLIFSLDNSNGEATTKTNTNGPPFLTILAGLLIFLLICWLVGSIVMWLVGLITNQPS